MNIFSTLGPVYTDPDKFLQEQKLAGFHLAVYTGPGHWTNFEWLSVQVLDLNKSMSQAWTLSRSKFRRVPPVPCKRKVELCKFLIRVNGALVTVQKKWVGSELGTGFPLFCFVATRRKFYCLKLLLRCVPDRCVVACTTKAWLFHASVIFLCPSWCQFLT